MKRCARPPGLRLGVTLVGSGGETVLSSKDLDVFDPDLARPAGRHISTCEIPANLLNIGQFFLSVGSDFPMVQGHFNVDRVLTFTVEASADMVGGACSGQSRRPHPRTIALDDGIGQRRGYTEQQRLKRRSKSISSRKEITLKVGILVDVEPGIHGGIATALRSLITALGKLEGPETYVLLVEVRDTGGLG